VKNKNQYFALTKHHVIKADMKSRVPLLLVSLYPRKRAHDAKELEASWILNTALS